MKRSTNLPTDFVDKSLTILSLKSRVLIYFRVPFFVGS